MSTIETHLRRIMHCSLERTPEEMLGECLAILIEVSGASGGSILGEEGPGLRFLFSDQNRLIGLPVPWDSIAGTSARENVFIYTHAPSDKQHYRGIDARTSRQTHYLLSLPIPSIHRSSYEAGQVKNAGVLQLLFEEDLFSELDSKNRHQQLTLEGLKRSPSYQSHLKDIFLILPSIAYAMEIVALRQTTSQAIHELKNKLISTASWLGCLSQDLQAQSPEVLEREDIREDLAIASCTAREGAELAKNFLCFTQIYSPRFEDVFLPDVVAQAVGSLKAFCDTSGCRVRVMCESDPDLPSRRIDTALLKMALFNLGKNAVEALSGVADAEATLTLAAQFENRAVVVSVRDNGPGIPQDVADKLFIPFKTRKKGGSGLGLAITKKIVDAHNAIIECATGPEGTCFSIRF
jgi:signal transduction histidine kinase